MADSLSRVLPKPSKHIEGIELNFFSNQDREYLGWNITGPIADRTYTYGDVRPTSQSI